MGLSPLHPERRRSEHIASNIKIIQTAIRNIFIISDVVNVLSSTDDIEDTCVVVFESVVVSVSVAVLLVEFSFVLLVVFVSVVVVALAEFVVLLPLVVLFWVVFILTLFVLFVVVFAVFTANTLKFKQKTETRISVVNNFTIFYLN